MDFEIDNIDDEPIEEIAEEEVADEQVISETIASLPIAEPEQQSLLNDIVVPKKTRKRKPKTETADGEVVVTKRTKKTKKVKEPSDLRYIFRKAMKALDIEKLKKPWMAEKAFRLLDTEEALERWVDGILSDTSRHYTYGNETCPVIAVDTETMGLDTRILVDIQQRPDGGYDLIYEVKIEIAGICLSPDGVEGIYIPINHEKGNNVSREAVRRILQKLFDRSHLVFYNAKFDREVLRLCCGINLRGYPHFEDVQSLAFINDPKADLGDKKQKYTGSSGGLKALSKNVLRDSNGNPIEQIELEEIGRFKASWCPITQQSFCTCTPEERKAASDQGKKHSHVNQYVPFVWVPTNVALWYAAGDAICTWLLWDKMKDLARSRRLPHRIDHELVDSLVFVERQRFLIDVDRHTRTSNWHTRLLDGLNAKLRELALEAGYPEIKTDEGVVLDDDKFNPDSPPQVGKLLYTIKKYEATHFSKKTGNASCDADAIDDLLKEHPEDEFLKTYVKYKGYSALHPSNLRYDPKDNSARIHLRQSTVAGGRLSASGGKFEEDGGFGLNPQGVKKVEPGKMWRVMGQILKPDSIPVEEIEAHEESELHPSCFFEDKEHNKKKAPGIINNHIGLYTGYAICLVPTCTTCKEKFGILIKDGFMDANQTVNLRCLFIAPPGWTFFSVDYSNIEMRAAANCSGEPAFIKEFLEGEGDFHSLTASKVFPEFNDPSTPPGKKKALRDLAKIINFALLYGGTSHAIYLNMKEVDPNITKEDCEKMVNKYWEGVPKFAEFVNAKQYKARTEFICETSTGRVISFLSAMEALRIHAPTAEEKQNLYNYYGIRREAETAKARHDMEAYDELRGKMDALWKDADSGVRNAMEYNKFVGKIQRVAVNAPIQGLCGDFMRIALNRLRMWVENDPEISSIFRLHTSVHDEVDFSVKNEYIPFILPRVTRLMKLRKYHTQMNWMVPIECDAEYGRSWDVDWNTTDPKKPAAWTHVDGMENYIPDEFDPASVMRLIKAITSFEPARVDKVKNWLKDSIHARAYECVKALDKALEKKDTKEVTRVLIAMLQLHEYWTIDHTPDGKEFDASLEKLEAYEARMGLSKADRGIKPEFGYLGAIPLECNVIRPKIEILGEEVVPEQAQIVVSETEINATNPETQTQQTITLMVEDQQPEVLAESPADVVTVAYDADYDEPNVVSHEKVVERPLREVPKAGIRYLASKLPAFPEAPHKDDKQAYVDWGVEVERLFKNEIAPHIGLTVKFNAEKKTNVGAIDFVIDHSYLADLKYQGKPFFSCCLKNPKHDLNPQTTVSYNYDDTKYADDVWVIFLVNWEILKGSDVPGYDYAGAPWQRVFVNPMGGVWRIKVSDIKKFIAEGMAPLHEYDRELDANGMMNESHSYLLDLSWPGFEQIAWFDYESTSEPIEPKIYPIQDSIIGNQELKTRLQTALGTGPHTVTVSILGKQYQLTGKALDYVPDEFLKHEELVHA